MYIFFIKIYAGIKAAEEKIAIRTVVTRPSRYRIVKGMLRTVRIGWNANRTVSNGARTLLAR